VSETIPEVESERGGQENLAGVLHKVWQPSNELDDVSAIESVWSDEVC
jgi:hypothetical protein